jgi:putative spermidine/putrescine transport system substrate-binding protein
VLYTQADQLLSLFEREEIAIAPWYPDRAGVAIDKGLSLAVAYPKEGAVGILPAVIIPKGTAKSELAHKFLDQILSAEGQGCFSERLYRRGQHQGEALRQAPEDRAPMARAWRRPGSSTPRSSPRTAPTGPRWQREVAR